MLLIFRMAFVILMLGPPVPVAADPHKDAQAAFDRGDYGAALRLNKPLADQGHAGAQFNLGVMFRHGQGVPQNNAEAMKWFRLAANQGRGDAQNNLGWMIRSGLGVPKNSVEAIKWYRMAANQGDADAQFILGEMLSMGEGVPKDDAEAMKWYRMAANQGDALAQLKIGEMLNKGRGGPEATERKSKPTPIIATCDNPISWQQAREYIGRTAAVVGPLMKVTIRKNVRGNPIFVDIGAVYPNPNRLALVIWDENKNTFPMVVPGKLEGMSVCIIGQIISFNGTPQIEMKTATQFNIMR